MTTMHDGDFIVTALMPAAPGYTAWYFNESKFDALPKDAADDAILEILTPLDVLGWATFTNADADRPKGGKVSLSPTVHPVVFDAPHGSPSLAFDALHGDDLYIGTAAPGASGRSEIVPRIRRLLEERPEKKAARHG